MVFPKAIDLADGFGCVGVWVDARPGAISFYARYGFVTLPSEAITTELAPMFLQLGTIRAAAPPRANPT